MNNRVQLNIPISVTSTIDQVIYVSCVISVDIKFMEKYTTQIPVNCKKDIYSYKFIISLPDCL